MTARVETPADIAELRDLVRDCSKSARPIRITGSGHEALLGNPVAADVAVDTRALKDIEDFDPDELVVRVGAGVTVGELRAMLAEHNLRAVVPEAPDTRTIGGVIATAASGYSRLRYGPIRNHVIGIALVSGAGDLVRAGGQVVKNVTGYDISRLAVGSMGRLGVIVEVALRVFSVRGSVASLEVADAAAATQTSVRPLAVLATRRGAIALVEGTPAAVAAQAGLLDARPSTAEVPVAAAWAWRATVRSRPAAQLGLLEHLPASWDYIAQVGTGLTEVGGDAVDPTDITRVRSLVETGSGRLVVHKVPEEMRAGLDAWGSPPSDLEIQRRLTASFDPSGIFNPGILPGGL